MRENKKPLYRKVNTTARGVHHIHGGDFKTTRGRNIAIGMCKGKLRGLDYTPLFKFLLSKVGSEWSAVYSEAVSRLDKEEPIFWLVAKNEIFAKEVVRIGESSYFSGLYIDDKSILQLVNPALDESAFKPHCNCCTYTFNGLLFTQKYETKNLE